MSSLASAARASLVAAALILAARVAPAAAQDPLERWTAAEEPADTALPLPAARPRGMPGHWNAETRVAGVVDSNANRDDDEVTAPGMVLSGLVGVQDRARRPRLRADYGVSLHAYSGAERWNRVSHRAQATYTRGIGGRSSIGATARAATGLVTLEHPRTEEVSVTPRLEFRPNATHRLGVEAGYRARRYDDASASTASGAVAGVDYRYRFASWRYLDLAVRYEDNDAEVARRSYDRVALTTAYTHPLGPRDRVRVRTTYRSIRYEARPLPVGEGGDTRDGGVVGSATWTHDFGGPVRTDVEYRAIVRRSNDPGREFDAHRVLLMLRYRW
jgi:hypothetical protein